MRAHSCGFLVCAALAALAQVGPARADALDAIGKKLSALGSETETLRQGIKRPSRSDAAARDRAERRLIDGQVAFGVGNYDDAAVMLYDYVERFPDSPSYDEAVYYLAESLFQKRDFMAARTSFTKLVVDIGPKSKFYQQGLERLVELSLKLRDNKDVDRWLSALDQLPLAERRASVPYVRGKYAYFQDDYAEAIRFFGGVPPSGEYYFQSRYFIGASYIALGQLGKAAQEYAQLIQGKADTIEQKRVVELAHMALGRIYYERDQPSKAIDEYTQVPRKSDLFDEALYEVAWVYVKGQHFDKALRALELLALADPTSAKLPEVRILEGNLRIRKAQTLAGKETGNSAEEYGKALTAFDTTHETFEKPHAELARVIADHAEPRHFMAQITGRTSETFDVRATLPEVAAAWIRDEPDVQRVVGIETDLGDIAAEIDEAERTIERLEQALSSPSRVNIFPSLADKRTRATEILEEIYAIRQQLATHERALVSRYATAAEKSQLERLEKQRHEIARQLAALPNAEVAYGERIERARNQYVELDQRAAEVATIIEATEATLVALDKYVRDQVAGGNPPANLADTQKATDELRVEMAALDRELEDIRREMVLAKDAAGTGDEAALRARQLRDKLRGALDAEHRVMLGIIGRMQGKDRGKGDQIAALTRSANQITGKLDQIQTTVDEIVELALADVRSSLADEKVRLSAYKREFVTYEAESQELGAVILGESFKEVKNKFYDVLVRSEIGVIDIAWSQKEALDEESQRLELDKQREVRTLTDEFRDVFEDSRGGGQ